MNLQTNCERQKKKSQTQKEDEELDTILNLMQPMGISMYRSYLDWFQKKDIVAPNHDEQFEHDK